MADKSLIQWTDATWNPVRGCAMVSAGCTNCYAMKQAHRFSGINVPGGPYKGLTRMTSSGPVWTGDVQFVEAALEVPLRWKRPRRIFVNSMSDLFHENLSDEAIDRIFAVMALCPQHTFQVLTKRAERMRHYLNGTDYQARHYQVEALRLDGPEARRSDIRCEIVKTGGREGYNRIEGLKWPLPNAWLGVSCEDQKTADERIPWLLQTPAAVRWVSYEPALGPVDFSSRPTDEGASVNWLLPELGLGVNTGMDPKQRINWIVVGGESGPGARPFDVQWARDTVAQCRAAGLPVFVKQLGAHPCFRLEDEERRGNIAPNFHHGHGDLFCKKLNDNKGGTPSEWPEDLRVREYPSVSALNAATSA